MTKERPIRTLDIDLRGFFGETTSQGEADPQNYPYSYPDEPVHRRSCLPA